MPAGQFFELYNAADDLLARNLGPDRAERVAVIDSAGEHTFAEIASAANRFAHVLESAGVRAEQRVLLALDDTVAFPICFLGAIKAGIVPVPVNTMLTGADYAYMLADSRAAAVVVASGLAEVFREILPGHLPAFVTGSESHSFTALGDALARAEERLDPAPTRPDDVAFWLYTSGTTGKPKGVMHAHTDLLQSAELYAQSVLELTAEDRVFSAAKLFFAYGLGNSLSFPFSVGATAVLLESAPSPDVVKKIFDEHRPTIFFGVPTLYAMLLNSDALPSADHRLRIAVSAGEALPKAIFDRWRKRVGIDILDGIGSTEMLHIFMSNRPGDVRPGSSGKAVPGYEVRLLDEEGQPTVDDAVGDLYVSGPTAALGYWNLREKSRATVQGRWVHTGDKYMRDSDGYYIYCGRSDDLLKVGGIYVSPMEVEDALLSHPAVAEAAVVGAVDDDELVKPKAFVVLAEGFDPGDTLASTLVDHVREVLASYKRPRWIEFVDALPKTATGKIQRYRLRGD